MMLQLPTSMHRLPQRSRRSPFPSRFILLAALSAGLLSSACGRRRTVAGVPPPLPGTSGRTAPWPPSTGSPGATETGYASWYGDPYHGRRAANGEIYDKNKMTAAHRTLPFVTTV